MLDIGFTELLLVAIIALVVLGPERLPHALKAGIYWMGKIRRSFHSVQSDLEREIGVGEIKRQIYNEEVMKELGETRDHLKSGVESLNTFDDRQSVSTLKNVSTESDVDTTNNPLR